MGGTANVLKILGSTSGDYGISSAGDDHDWSKDALCAGRWDEFQPVAQIFPGDETAVALAAVCAECPVLAQCRERAREADAQFGAHGFWAGLTESERIREDAGISRPSAADLRDQRVVELMAHGLSDREMAERLGVARATVQASRSRTGMKPAHDRRGGARGRSPIERIR